MIGDIKHVFNRGVNKINIFNNDYDRTRFLECLYKFNNKDTAIRSEAEDFFSNPPPQEEKIVEILKWSLMPNHFHLLLYEVTDGGITEFIKRLGNGYTKYFNIKNKRKGYLFQNSTKMVRLENDQQFLYIPYYIDMNPIDLKFPDWKKKGLADTEKVIDFLDHYEWSSFPDYCTPTRQRATLTARNISCLTSKELFYDLFDIKESEYQKELTDFIKNPIQKSEIEW
jgi:putative transposase